MNKKKLIFSIFTITTIGLFIHCCDNNANGRRIRTNIDLRKAELPSDKTERPDNTVTVDTLSLNDVTFFGFDKPLSSTKESFFVTNHTDNEITGIELDIEYLTIDSLQLHRRTVNIDCSIPGKQTRKIDIPSWDKQKSFYFFQSAKPRKQATPFMVIFHPKSFKIRD